MKAHSVRKSLLALSVTALLANAMPAAAQECMIGEIKAVGFNFPPFNWISAEGQLLPISQYTNLFSLYGTYYGGDGRTTFAMPDLRGRSPIGIGTGPGLSGASLGQQIGSQTHTMSSTEMASHTHDVTINASSSAGNTPVPENNTWAELDRYDLYSDVSLEAGGSVAMATDVAIASATGGGQPFSIQSPALALTYIICNAGFYPSRS